MGELGERGCFERAPADADNQRDDSRLSRWWADEVISAGPDGARMAPAGADWTGMAAAHSGHVETSIGRLLN